MAETQIETDRRIAESPLGTDQQIAEWRRETERRSQELDELIAKLVSAIANSSGTAGTRSNPDINIGR